VLGFTPKRLRRFGLEGGFAIQPAEPVITSRKKNQIVQKTAEFFEKVEKGQESEIFFYAERCWRRVWRAAARDGRPLLAEQMGIAVRVPWLWHSQKRGYHSDSPAGGGVHRFGGGRGGTAFG